MRLCSNVPAQCIIQTALGGYQSSNEMIAPGGRIYQQREFITNRLNSIPGISTVKPKAAFYIFPKIDIKKFSIYNDEKFVLDFLTQQHVLLVHGGGFNWKQPDHFRIVYLPRMEELKIAMDYQGAVENFILAMEKCSDNESIIWIIVEICAIYKQIGLRELAKEVLNGYYVEYRNLMAYETLEQIKSNL
jgi:hypothetical protein